MHHARSFPATDSMFDDDGAAASAGGGEDEYEDLVLVMAVRLDAELRAGFRLLADLTRGAMTAAEAEAMVQEGDQDGDGALSEAEFCVLMVRLSPGIMGNTEGWLEEAIAEELFRSPPSVRNYVVVQINPA